MMNVLEQEDIIKGLPDQALMQEAQMPSGQVPQYLVVSEIQRRSDMRKRYKADQGQMPQGTVKDKVVQEGIMASMPPQMAMAPQMAQRMPNMPPPQMPPQGIEQVMPPQMMSGGGIVRMSTGGRAQEILDLVAVGLSPLQIAERGYEEEEISMTMDEYNRRMAPTDGSLFEGSSRIIGTTEREDPTYQRRPTGFLDDPGAIGDAVRENVLEPIGSAAKYVSEIPGRIAHHARMSEAINPLSNSLLLASDMPEPFKLRKTDPYGYRDALTPEQINQRLENRPSLVDDLDMTPMDFFRQRVLGESPSDKKDASVQGRSKIQTQGIPSIMPEYTDYTTLPGMEALDEPESYQGPFSLDYLRRKNVEEKARELARKELEGTVTSDPKGKPDPVSETVDALTKQPGNDKSNPANNPALDFADLIADSRRQAMSNALIQLGAGIAGGDVSKGIAAAGQAATEGTQASRDLDMKRRLAEYEAGREDLRRGEEARRYDEGMKLKREEFQNDVSYRAAKLAADIEAADDISRRSLLTGVNALLEEASGELVRLDQAGGSKEEMLELQTYINNLREKSRDYMNEIAAGIGRSGSYDGYELVGRR